MTAIPRQHSIHAWRPDVGAAVAALGAMCQPNFVDTFRKELTDDVRAVLDASGANQEIERLRAVLHAAQQVIDTLRAENIEQLNLLLVRKHNEPQ